MMSGSWPTFRSMAGVYGSLWIRRLRSAAVDCVRQTFRGLLPGVLERYQRHTPRLAEQIGAVVRGRSQCRPWRSPGTPPCVLLRLPLPALRVPQVLEVDGFALRRRHCYATILIDAETRSSPATGPLAASTALPGLRAAQTRCCQET